MFRSLPLFLSWFDYSKLLQFVICLDSSAYKFIYRVAKGNIFLIEPGVVFVDDAFELVCKREMKKCDITRPGYLPNAPS